MSRSRQAQGLPPKALDQAIIARLATLIAVARDTERTRQTEKSQAGNRPGTESGEITAPSMTPPAS
ncbi:hypothetical protein [Streptomyces agglomeratus]|uniref:hypothetical protein n=1 Tax=Streptomyces agglomeratus TaxID=285458 RepID=UPI00114D2588|nr:hypothetical protein [Streptomyces agglomeratus]